MNYLSIINPIFAVYNYITSTTSNIWNTSVSVYRLCTTTPVWYILDNGQFANSSDMNIIDKNVCWQYDGSVISMSHKYNPKKLPFLSFEFNYSDVVVNMDDFIENTKYQAENIPPLAVIMAAFTIKSKVLYAWNMSDFTVFSKMGDEIKFSGKDGKLPDT